ncbi:MAG TPA: superoxide dismutase family protein [Pseudonocardiaceae bacterium]|nr:superoxide dismutase family protein [Pseudonocardiaceae bacterium]
MKKRVLAAVGVAVVAVGAGVSTAVASNDAHASLRIGQVRLVDPAGGSLGTVQLVELGGRLHVIGKVRGLAAGFHGFHIHEKGECIGSSTPPFASAGGHLSTTSDSHPGHAGDMPVLLVGRDGSAQASFTTDRLTLADVFDPDGSAIIVHANADNYANIPTRYAPGGPDGDTLKTGDSGGRVACGVVTRR